jgi:hypothetical protein
MAERDEERSVFVLESGDSAGYVVAGVMATHEDDVDYSDPSWLTVD